VMTKRQRHWHKQSSVTEHPYRNCVGMSCNPDAHDGRTYVEVCICGHKRHVNFNISNYTGKEIKEYGTWILELDRFLGRL